MKKNDENNYTYRTGRTQPPKSYQGLIAVLLILVIFLAGAVSALSLMNIRLFYRLEETNNRSARFSQEDQGVSAMSVEEPAGVEATALGFTWQEFTALYRSYQQWPQGIYICTVEENGPAEYAGVQVGDILVAMNDMPISDTASFQDTLPGLTPGETVKLTVFRDGREMTLDVTISQ